MSFRTYNDSSSILMTTLRFVNRSPLKATHNLHGRDTFMSSNSTRNTSSNNGSNSGATENCGDAIPQCRIVSRHLTVSEVESTWKAATLGK